MILVHSTKEVAKAVGITHLTLQRWVARGGGATLPEDEARGARILAMDRSGYCASQALQGEELL